MATAQGNSATPLSVLFVEDSQDDVDLAVLALERDGFAVKWKRVDLERDLRAALAANGPEIVLSDYSMPAFDGLSALRVVREMKPDLPFIFMSGTIGEERAIASIHSGATDYILKGNIKRLSTAVRRALADAADRNAARIAEESRARLAATLEATSDFVAICDHKGQLVYVNTAARRLAGTAMANGHGSSIFAMHPEWVHDFIRQDALPAAVRDGTWQGESAVLAADGSEIPVSQVIISQRGADGRVQYYSTIARDISERKAYEDKIRHLANFDALTGLPNRTLLADRVAQAIAHRRHSGRTPALLAVDIDRFKLVNDGYGHGAGDKLLKLAGERLQDLIRAGDTAARLGADGFAVLATDLAQPEDALAVARKLQSGMRSPFRIDGRDVHITVSVGVAVHPRDGADFDTLLRNADVAMHRAKAGGHEGAQFYASEMTREAIERVELESALRSALARRELELHYQPQLNLETGAVVGVEALMRWRHAERGWISPMTFIPIAEHSDLIYPLGEWALTAACSQLKKLNGSALRLAVNVSARQFRSSGFAESVGRILRDSGINPAQLELELTESVLVQDQDEALAILSRLNELGVQIAIDDFGTGYSSLSYLSRLPIDCLKIDKTFVQRFAEDKHDAAIVQTIISLAGALGLRVVAEGVETGAQLDFLRRLHCAEAQGYLFAKAMPVDEARGYIKSHRARES